MLVRSLCRETEDLKATTEGRMVLLEDEYSRLPRNSVKTSRDMMVSCKTTLPVLKVLLLIT